MPFRGEPCRILHDYFISLLTILFSLVISLDFSVCLVFCIIITSTLNSSPAAQISPHILDTSSILSVFMFSRKCLLESVTCPELDWWDYRPAGRCGLGFSFPWHPKESCCPSGVESCFWISFMPLHVFPRRWLKPHCLVGDPNFDIF